MYKFAIIIGVYSYVIFFFGLFHLLKGAVLEVSFLVLLLMGLFLVKDYIKIPHLKFNFFSAILLFPLFLQILVNFVGALGPEIAFDALWYHLTLPKMYLLSNSIYYVPGNLLYYSAMPKLAEMLYIPVLYFSSEVGVKILHFLFGILVCVSLYNFSRKFFDKFYSLLIVVIFYANLVVDWESITAYVDLIWAFFTFLSFTTFISFCQTKKMRWLILSSILTGFAITAKLNGFELDVIYIFLFLYIIRSIKAFFYSFLFTLVSLIIPLPWLIFSYIYTRNPVFPFFSSIYPIENQSLLQLINPIHIISSILILFLHSANPISPIYFISIPLIILYFKKFNKVIKLATIFSFIAILLWYFIPQTGGSRFIIPYLSGFSIVVGQVIFLIKNKRLKYFFIFTIIFISTVSIIYRGVANEKYLPVILGQETKAKFLSSKLNYNFGDFYDTDSYFVKHIKSSDRVLLYGFHNLYYVDFLFVDSSWVTKNDKFDYIATQNTTLPKNFKSAKLIYKNSKTHVQLYKLVGYEHI